MSHVAVLPPHGVVSKLELELDFIHYQKKNLMNFLRSNELPTSRATQPVGQLCTRHTSGTTYISCGAAPVLGQTGPEIL